MASSAQHHDHETITKDSRPDDTPLHISSLDPSLQEGDQGVCSEISPENLCDLLFSRQHLRLVLEDPNISRGFITFVRTYRPGSVTTLTRYINLTKALKSLLYAEAIMHGLEAAKFQPIENDACSFAMPWVIQDKIERILDLLMVDDFRAFIAHLYVKIVDSALADRVMAMRDPTMPSKCRGLAEVFILSDPARQDNPICFTSDDFQRMTGYLRKDFIGRNCRILGGPKTSQLGIRRLQASLDAGQEHCEILLN